MKKINKLKKYIEKMISKCTELGGMEKEKWAFRQVYKKIKEIENNEENKGQFYNDWWNGVHKKRSTTFKKICR